MRIISALLLSIAFILALAPAYTQSEMSMSTFIVQHDSVPGDKGRFKVRTSDPKLIQKARQDLAKPIKRRLHISGKLASGNGQFNQPWHWHIVDDQWDLAELHIELCDGTPEMVEKDTTYWVSEVKTFCPWHSYLLKEVK